MNPDPDEERCKFFKNIIHPMIDRHWESMTFREFLEEKNSNDEIYFYLLCRFFLFKGGQLNHLQGGLCFSHWIKFENVLQIIDLIFRGFDEENINFLKRKLKNYCKFKNHNNLINAGFVLRIFLEYYHNERKHRYKLIKEIFQSKSKEVIHNSIIIKYI